MKILTAVVMALIATVVTLSVLVGVVGLGVAGIWGILLSMGIEFAIPFTMLNIVKVTGVVYVAAVVMSIVNTVVSGKSRTED